MKYNWQIYLTAPLVAFSFLLSACVSSSDMIGGDDDVEPLIPMSPLTQTHKAPAQRPADKPPVERAQQDEPRQTTPSPTVAPKPVMPGVRVNSVSTPDKLVALTFDDGPHGVYTPQILDILAKYNAKCTFFMLGSNVASHPAIVRRVVTEGHEVASHTWNHPQLTKLSADGIRSQMDRTEAAIIDACGVKPRVMRPPYGAVNANVCAQLNSRYGYKVILWNVDTNDWRKPGVSTVISRAVNGAKPGAIILVHDIHGSTAAAVEGIVKGITEKGYRLVTVSELLANGARYARTEGSAAVENAESAEPVAEESDPTPHINPPALISACLPSSSPNRAEWSEADDHMTFFDGLPQVTPIEPHTPSPADEFIELS